MSKLTIPEGEVVRISQDTAVLWEYPESPVEPDNGVIIITEAMYTAGKKLMPDGSVTDETNAYTTLSYIDVSDLSDTFTFEFGENKGWALRIAQYNENKESLSDNFAHTSISDSSKQNIDITKLSGCKYIRIFSTASATVGQLVSV
jgi:hypothetical protein